MGKKSKSYQESIAEIKEIIQKIENDELDVDALSENVKKVHALLSSCKEKLRTTEEEIQKIIDDIED